MLIPDPHAPEKAREVLRQMGCKFRSDGLIHGTLPWTMYQLGDKTAVLDGEYTAEQLLALATLIGTKMTTFADELRQLAESLEDRMYHRLIADLKAVIIEASTKGHYRTMWIITHCEGFDWPDIELERKKRLLRRVIDHATEGGVSITPRQDNTLTFWEVDWSKGL